MGGEGGEGRMRRGVVRCKDSETYQVDNKQYSIHIVSKCLANYRLHYDCSGRGKTCYVHVLVLGLDGKIELREAGNIYLPRLYEQCSLST